MVDSFSGPARPYPLKQLDYLNAHFDPAKEGYYAGGRTENELEQRVNNALLLLGARSNLHGPRHYELDHSGLPWQLLGANDYIRDTVDTSVTEQGDFYTRVLLPWTSDPNPNISWNQLAMDQPLAQRVPEGGVTPLLRMDSTRHHDKAVRRGLAIRIDRDFMVSEVGQESFVLALRGLIRAVRHTVNFGVLSALVDAAPPPLLRSDHDPHAAAVRLAREEAVNYACLQKRPNAVRQVLALARDRRHGRSADVDTVVLPPGAGLYVRFRPEELGCLEKPAADEPVEMLGCRVFEAEWVPVGAPDGSRTGIESPLVDRREVGELYLTRFGEPVQLYDESRDSYRVWDPAQRPELPGHKAEEQRAVNWLRQCDNYPPAHPAYALCFNVRALFELAEDGKNITVNQNFKNASPTLFPSALQAYVANANASAIDEDDSKPYSVLATKFGSDRDAVSLRRGVESQIRQEPTLYKLFALQEACLFDGDMHSWWQLGDAGAKRSRFAMSDASVERLQQLIRALDFNSRCSAMAMATFLRSGALKGVPELSDLSRKVKDEAIFKDVRVLTVRPFIRHKMGSAVALKAGTETGRTMYGHNDFKITEDNVSECYYGNLTFYSKSVVTQPNNVTVLPHVFSCGYVDGNDVEPLRLHDADGELGPDSLVGSCYSIEVSAHDPAFGPDGVRGAPIDITGCHVPGSPLSRAGGGQDEGGVHWCGGYEIYRALQGHRTLGHRGFYAALDPDKTVSMQELYWRDTPARNTVLFTGSYQRCADEPVDGDFATPEQLSEFFDKQLRERRLRTVRGNGHWAGLSQPGDAARRAGEAGR
jgi:hypothetical protein